MVKIQRHYGQKDQRADG